MTANRFILIMFVTTFLCVKTMENVITIDVKNSISMPSRKILEEILQDTSLHHYAQKEEIDAFYNLAEKNVSAGFLLYIFFVVYY